MGAGCHRQNPGREPYPQDSWASFLGLSSLLKANVSQSSSHFKNSTLYIKSFSCFAGFSLGNVIMSGVPQALNSYFNEFVDRSVYRQCVYMQVPPSVGTKLTLYPSWGSSSSGLSSGCQDCNLLSIFTAGSTPFSHFICLSVYLSIYPSIYFPGGSDGKESTCNVGDLGSIPGLGRSSGEENDNPFQYSCLENSMDRGAWQVTVLGVIKSWT